MKNWLISHGSDNEGFELEVTTEKSFNTYDEAMEFAKHRYINVFLSETAIIVCTDKIYKLDDCNNDK